MKILNILFALLIFGAVCFGQAVSVTQSNPYYQTPNQWSGGQSWTALGPMYTDFVALNNVAATLGGNNNFTGNPTFTGTVTITGGIAGLKSTVYSDSTNRSVALTAAQSGLVVQLKYLAGDTIALPASATCAVGTRFKIIFTYSSTSIGHCINTNGSDVFYGTLFEMSTTTVSPFTSTANKTILCTPTTACGLRGSYIDVMYIGGGLWQTSGLLYGSGTVVTAFKN